MRRRKACASTLRQFQIPTQAHLRHPSSRPPTHTVRDQDHPRQNRRKAHRKRKSPASEQNPCYHHRLSNAPQLTLSNSSHLTGFANVNVRTHAGNGVMTRLPSSRQRLLALIMIIHPSNNPTPSGNNSSRPTPLYCNRPASESTLSRDQPVGVHVY